VQIDPYFVAVDNSELFDKTLVKERISKLLPCNISAGLPREDTAVYIIGNKGGD
jgi:hypothetical protein